MNLGPHGGYSGVGSGRESGEIRQITAVLGLGLEDRGHQNDCHQKVNLDFSIHRELVVMINIIIFKATRF
jgi:hypothetical protein